MDIILPVYNAEKYLEFTLKSIVNSDGFEHYRLILINDGSTDNSLVILSDYSEKYSNIQLISRENRGLVVTLNEAITLCNAPYVARVDADDTVLPSRFSRQISFLEKHHDIYVLGMAFNLIDEKNRYIKTISMPCGMNKMKAYSFFGSPICHPTVMFRGELFYQHKYTYPEASFCEDYCLWLDVMSKYRVENLNEVGINYRMTSTGISLSNVMIQTKNTLKNRNLFNFMNISKKMITHADIIYAPRTNKTALRDYFKSFINLIPTIYRSDISFSWFLIYGINGLIIKIGIRK